MCLLHFKIPNILNKISFRRPGPGVSRNASLQNYQVYEDERIDFATQSCLDNPLSQIRVTASSLNSHAFASFGHQSKSSTPFPGAVIDFINLMTGLPLANLADLLHVNNNAMELREAMVVEEYITVDDNLPVSLPLGSDWGDTWLLRFKEGQSDATECSGDREAKEEQVEQPCLITSSKDTLK